jgi:hypothetical protein
MAPKKDLPRFRIIPRKLGAALFTLFFGVFLVMLLTTAFVEFDSVIVNGRQVYGEERDQAVQQIRFMSLLFMIPILLLFLSNARRLLPGSPFDYIEIGPVGLTARGFMGRRHRRWDHITGFSAGRFLFFNPQLDWIKVESDSPLRFTLSGYLRSKLFSVGNKEVQAIADWLEMVRGAYVFGSDSPPPAPPELAGKIIELSETPVRPLSSRSGVIER